MAADPIVRFMTLVLNRDTGKIERALMTADPPVRFMTLVLNRDTGQIETALMAVPPDISDESYVLACEAHPDCYGVWRVEQMWPGEAAGRHRPPTIGV
jgi:hypothetical protein